MADIKRMRRQGKKDYDDCMDIMEKMRKHLHEENAHGVMLAEAFLHMLNYHLHHGDLQPKNVHLASLLRREL